VLDMPGYTAQVIARALSGLARDDTVNTLHFSSGANQGTQPLADDLEAAFRTKLGGATQVCGGMKRWDVKVYEDGPKPNPPKTTKIGATQPVYDSGPREVALCLSFKGTAALSGLPAGLTQKQRGRIFVGPFHSSRPSSARPPENLRITLLDLGSLIKTAGGAGFLWICGSDQVTVSNLWVDDEWDTQRRRGFRPTARSERVV
jgi:hypothetical protein